MKKVNIKLINDETLFESKKRYLGTFTLVKIPELSTIDDIPPLVASLKYEKTSVPEKRYIV